MRLLEEPVEEPVEQPILGPARKAFGLLEGKYWDQ